MYDNSSMKLQMKTDRTILDTKPEIRIRENDKDIAISGDKSVMQKEAGNVSKYKGLSVEIQHAWNAKTKVIPVLIGALSEPFQNHSENT